jgi:hypothetical protein
MVDYKDFLESAAKSLEDYDSEISNRNVMSRAYYGLYHLALSYADSVAVPPVSACKGPTHEKLSTFFEKSIGKDKALMLKMLSIGYSLKQYHRKRCKADYTLDEAVSRIEAEAQLQNCLDKVDVLRALQEAHAA